MIFIHPQVEKIQKKIWDPRFSGSNPRKKFQATSIWKWGNFLLKKCRNFFLEFDWTNQKNLFVQFFFQSQESQKKRQFFPRLFPPMCSSKCWKIFFVKKGKLVGIKKNSRTLCSKKFDPNYSLRRFDKKKFLEGKKFSMMVFSLFPLPLALQCKKSNFR